MNIPLKPLLCLLALVITLSAKAELEFSQQTYDIGSNDSYRDLKTFDLDADGDIDIYYLWGNVFKWFENNEGEFTLNETIIEAGEYLRLIEVENDTIDFWGLEFHDDSSISINAFHQNENYAKRELINLPYEDDGFRYFFSSDFNGDGNVDFLVLKENPTDLIELNEFTIVYYYGSENNQFEKVVAEDKFFVTTENGFSYYLKLLDVNNDGLMDVVYFDYNDSSSGSLRYHKSTPNNSYEHIQIVEELYESTLSRLQYLSRDADGLLNLFIFENVTTWYQQINDTFVERSFRFNDFRHGTRVFFEDYDNDNDYDMISFPSDGSGGQVYVYDNVDGDFPSYIEVGLLNANRKGVQTLSKPGDNLMSFTAKHDSVYFSSRFVHLQVNDNQLTEQQISNDFIDVSSVSVEDITGNNLKDMVIYDRNSPDVISLTQTSQYQFVNNNLLNLDRYPQAIKLLDADQDGDKDLYIVNSDSDDSYFEVFNNDGAGGFTLIESIQLPYNFSNRRANVELVDLNLDGLIDITVGGNLGMEIFWMLNLNGSFDYQPIINVSPTNYSAMSYDFGDINGDGYLDLAYSFAYYCHFTCFGSNEYHLFDEQTNSFFEGIPINNFTGPIDQVLIENLDDNNRGEVVLTNLVNGNFDERQVYTMENDSLVVTNDPLDFAQYLFRPNDINSDGVVDFLYYAGSGVYKFLTSNEGHNWGPEESNGLDLYVLTNRSFEDVDGNGDIDLITQYGRSILVSYQGDLILPPAQVNSNKTWALLMIFGLMLSVAYQNIRNNVRSSKRT